MFVILKRDANSHRFANRIALVLTKSLAKLDDVTSGMKQ
jgi:hypothetical protein